jgi:hypothetical protein
MNTDHLFFILRTCDCLSQYIQWNFVLAIENMEMDERIREHDVENEGMF